MHTKLAVIVVDNMTLWRIEIISVSSEAPIEDLKLF